jgi:hypothetical protein
MNDSYWMNYGCNGFSFVLEFISNPKKRRERTSKLLEHQNEMHLNGLSNMDESNLT